MSGIQKSWKIMPAGDSNTMRGERMPEDGFVGYRFFLKQLLTDGGIAHDFVGSQRSELPEGDSEHEGYPGLGLEKIISRVQEGALETYQPDIILLNVGANDMWVSLADRSPISDEKARYWVERLGVLLDEMLRRLPAAAIIVAKPTTPGNTPRPLALYRAGIDELVQARANAGGNIRTIDLAGCENDGTHFTDPGYAQVAERWYAAIRQVILAPKV